MRISTKKSLLLTILFSSTIGLSSWAQFGHMSHNNAMQMANNYQNAKEQGKNLNSYLGYSVGIGFAFTTAKFEHRYSDIVSIYENNIEQITDLGEKVITRTPKVTGFHINANTYYRIAELSEHSILAFNVGVIGYLLKYDIGKINLSEMSSYDYTMASIQLGVPLCLDYKYGGEAIYNKSQKTSFTLGVGVAPILYVSSFGPMANTRGDFRPFLRAEIGIFAGIEWRITGSVLGGNSKIMNFKDDYGSIIGKSANISVNSTPTYSISLSFMPFSYDWESFGW